MGEGRVFSWDITTVSKDALSLHNVNFFFTNLVLFFDPRMINAAKSSQDY